MPQVDEAWLAETASLVALLRTGSRPASHFADLVEDVGSAARVLELDQGLLAPQLSEAAAADVAHWLTHGLQLVTVLDGNYPQLLRAVHDRPPVIFVAGKLHPSNERAVAIIGSRRAPRSGLEHAREMTTELIRAGYTIVSGLAAGVDTAAHTTALELGAPTIAVLGNGLNRCFPPQNASLQRRIASNGALVSQFWPDLPPSRKTFPQRNALMSGMALATLIVEATHTSGARIQARHALAHGRPVLLAEPLLSQSWARKLGARPGVHVVHAVAELPGLVERLSSAEAPTP